VTLSMPTGAADASVDTPISSPFSAGRVEAEAAPADALGAIPHLAAPFVGALHAREATEYTSDASEMLAAELEDELLAEAVDALVAEGSGRYLQALAGPEASGTGIAREAPALWLAQVGAHTERMLAELEERLGDRPLTALREHELDDALGGSQHEARFVAPQDAQELFGFSIVSKLKKAASGAVALAKKGVAAVANLTLKPVLAMLRRKAAAILKAVLRKIVGSTLMEKVPPPLRPIAARLAASMGISEAEAAGELDEVIGGEALAEWFDRELADELLSGDAGGPAAGEAEAESELGGGRLDDELFATASQAADPLEALDVARATLARELLEVPEGQSPTAQLERFLPAVMAVRPAIRFAINRIGRPKIVRVIARPMAALIEGKIGKQAAAQLSTYLASTGLGLAGLEAESGDAALGGGTIGTEALVAAAEETFDRVLSLPPASLEDELLVAAEVQEAFAEAAARHLPASVLRDDLVAGEDESERGVWLMMPRSRSLPHYRYKKLSSIIPVAITRPIARAVVLRGGETLEQNLLESGEDRWPVSAELEVYELLAGGTAGQVAAFESGEPTLEAQAELSELTEVAAAALARDPALARRPATAVSAGPRGTRLFRLRVGGRAVRGRSRFSVRASLAAASPTLSVRLFIGERDAHALSAAVAKRHMVQVIARVRGILDPALEQALARRLAAMMRRRRVALADATGRALARTLVEAMLRALSAKLPESAPALAAAARDAASGITLAFDIPFPSVAALAKPGAAEASGLTITAGRSRG
jgi:hypothetical protein